MDNNEKINETSYDYNVSANLKEITDTQEKNEIQVIYELKSKNNTNNRNLSFAYKRVILFVLGLLLLIMVISGIAMFIISISGMAMENLKNISKNMGANINGLFYGNTSQDIDTNYYDTLDYIKTMGYDLKGMGFLTEYVGSSSDGVELYEDGENEGKIKNAKSDFLSLYLLSDNYLYSISNYAVDSGKLGLSGVIDRALGNSTILRMFSNLINDTKGKWGTGLIGFYYDTGTFGEKGSSYGDGPFSWNEILI